MDTFENNMLPEILPCIFITNSQIHKYPTIHEHLQICTHHTDIRELRFEIISKSPKLVFLLIFSIINLFCDTISCLLY